MNWRSLLLLALAFPAIARGGGGSPVVHEVAELASPSLPFSGEFILEQSYVGDSNAARGGRQVKDFDELYSNVRFVYTPRLKYGILRLGAQFERYSFGFSGSGQQLPGALQAVNAIVGFDTQFSDSILVRLEAQPGFYGTTFDHLSGDQFNIPFVLGGTYVYSPALQFVFGFGVNVQQKYPIIPGGGVRWKFAPNWVLNAVLPTPRLEYALNRSVTLSAGGEVKANTFRVDDHFGDGHGDPALNKALLSYSEVRTGAGVDWKLTSSLTFRVEGGYVPYRNFDYYRTEVRYHNEGGGAYGSVMLQGSF